MTWTTWPRYSVTPRSCATTRALTAASKRRPGSRGASGCTATMALTPQQVDGVTEIEVGYHLRTGLQGRGLATEAASACRDHARDVLGLERLIAIIDPRNRPSQRVAEKLGLVVERESDNHGRWSSPRRIYAMSWSG